MWTTTDTVATVAAGAQVVAASFTLYLAFMTRNLARETGEMSVATKEMAVASVQEAAAVVAQGGVLERQAKATTEQAASVAEQAKASAQQAAASAAQAAASTDQLELTRVSLELTRLGLRSSVQPWITVGENDEFRGNRRIAGMFFSGSAPSILVNESDGSLFVSVQIRNVGIGLAIVDPQQSHLLGYPDTRSATPSEMMAFTAAEIGNPVLQPEQDVRLDFVLDLEYWRTSMVMITGRALRPGSKATLAYQVAYTDTIASDLTLARVQIIEDEPKQWSAYRIDYFRPPGEASPFVTANFR